MSVTAVHTRLQPHAAGPTPLSPAELLRLTRELARDHETWRSLVQHTPWERWCSRIAAHDDHDVWLIGWDSYQGVDLHDHGGSSGALYVVEGELLETSTRREGVFLQEEHLLAGTARAFGPGHVHRVVNPSATPATSVHVYSPPLVTMDFFAAAGGTLATTHSEPALGTRSGRGELR
jgi:mannose-6-phosphate isomerase-like protein (cupin superfamily)